MSYSLKQTLPFVFATILFCASSSALADEPTASLYVQEYNDVKGGGKTPWRRVFLPTDSIEVPVRTSSQPGTINMIIMLYDRTTRSLVSPQNFTEIPYRFGFCLHTESSTDKHFVLEVESSDGIGDIKKKLGNLNRNDLKELSFEVFYTCGNLAEKPLEPGYISAEQFNLEINNLQQRQLLYSGRQLSNIALEIQSYNAGLNAVNERLTGEVRAQLTAIPSVILTSPVFSEILDENAKEFLMSPQFKEHLEQIILNIEDQ